MDVSVVILSYNTRDLLRRCLRTTLANLDDLEAEVIVVDNASADGSAAMARDEFPCARVIETGRNLGYAGGNNVGIRAARGEFVLVLNSDAFLGDGALRGMVRHMREHPRAGVVGPRLAHEDGQLHFSCRHFPTLARHACWVLGLHRLIPLGSVREWDWMTSFAHDRPRRVDMVSGACWMLRRAMVEQMGPLNDALFLYGEEFDLCWRAARAGWQTWFVPAGPVVHAGGRSSPTSPSRDVLTNFHRYRSGYLTMRWHRGTSAALLAAAMDQTMLRLRLWKSRFWRADPPARREALVVAIANSRRAAGEMILWRERPRVHAP